MCGLVKVVKMLLDRRRRYGVSRSHELSHFLKFISIDTDRGISIKNTFLKSQMYYNLPKIIFEIQVPFTSFNW